MPSPLQMISSLLDLEREGLRRFRHSQSGQSTTVACSNDYLGLSSASTAPTGATGSRLVVGDLPVHRKLERALSQWVGLPDALLFTSGFAANVGVIPAIANQHDLIVSATLNHASIIDGCRLSRATCITASHDNTDQIRSALRSRTARAKWIITEAYFSMDGLVPDLETLAALAAEEQASLMVDEAHSLGVFGPSGAGLCAQSHVTPDILIGTLGKAVAAQGAFAAASTSTIDWLWNHARSFVYSTGMSPLLCETTLRLVDRARHADDARVHLFRMIERARQRLRSLGVAVVDRSTGPIIPIIIGSAKDALATQERLREKGIASTAIRPPTVPEGTARLRVTITASMNQETVDRIVDAIAESAT